MRARLRVSHQEEDFGKDLFGQAYNALLERLISGLKKDKWAGQKKEFRLVVDQPSVGPANPA
jgi:hypothetical protein